MNKEYNEMETNLIKLINKAKTNETLDQLNNIITLMPLCAYTKNLSSANELHKEILLKRIDIENYQLYQYLYRTLANQTLQTFIETIGALSTRQKKLVNETNFEYNEIDLLYTISNQYPNFDINNITNLVIKKYSQPIEITIMGEK